LTFHKTADTLTKGSKTLPRKFYTEPDILNQEFKKIFHNNWVCIGRDSDLTTKGQYITIQLGSESIIVLKSNKDKIKAFFNVCRHRGTRICNSNEGKFSKTIQCPYHGWTYDLNGKLIGSPLMEAVNDFNKSDYPLFPIKIKQWKGFLFINLNENPRNLNETFKPINNLLHSWELKNLCVIDKKRYAVNCNWKLIIQNYCECYHCPMIHPQLAEIHNYLGGKNNLYSGPFLGGYMNFNSDKESITPSGKYCCPPIKGIKGRDLHRVYYYSLFPNMLLSLHPEYVMYHTVWPNGVDKCIVNCSWLFLEENANNHKNSIYEAIDFWDKTNKQDWEICEYSQLGINSKKYSPSPYSGQESLLAAFDEYYINQMDNNKAFY